MPKYHGTISTDIITTKVANEVITFKDPHNEELTIGALSLLIENRGDKDLFFSINNEWNTEKRVGTKHLVDPGGMIGFDDIEIGSVVVHDIGSKVLMRGQF